MASREHHSSGRYTSDFNTGSEHVFAAVRSNRKPSVAITEPRDVVDIEDEVDALAGSSMVWIESGADGCYGQDLRVEVEQADQFAELPATLERGDPNVAVSPIEDETIVVD